MRDRLLYTLLLLVILAPQLTEAATAPDAWADSAAAAYDRGDYKEALDHYKAIATDFRSPSLYYNMGNAALKAGELGSAVLYYRKAEKLAPWDPDVKNNLKIALKKARDDFETKHTRNGILSGIKNFVVERPLGKWWPLAFIASLFSGLVAVVITLRRRSSHGLEWGILILFLVLSGSFFAADRWRTKLLEKKDRAVIRPPSVKVKSEPRANAETTFVLHEGTTVDKREKEEGWTEIRTPDDQVGWIPADKATSF